MKKQQYNVIENRGITLIALVVTIIVLIILAGISISMLTGENGILSRAQEAKNRAENSQAEELSAMSQLENEMLNQQDDGFDKTKGVNRPQLATGMTRIMFNDPTDSKSGTVIKDGENGWSQNDWYDYTESAKKWANVMTKDGSMWVWIPRYAYKIDENKNMDIKFLVGTSNKWYNPETKQAEDLPVDYKIHPCFQNGSKTGYKNGEWKAEIRGIWVAKFEAGFPDDKSAPKTTSVEGLTNGYYPVFQGQKYSYNYINVSCRYLLSKNLTESNNPYGLTSSTDSHLIKNSEWGAIAYLSYSKYGKTGGTYNDKKEVYINNVSFDGKINSVRGTGVYAVTGYAGSAQNSGTNIITDTKLKDTVKGNLESYAWYTKKGIEASTTGNIYGLYDMSGGAAEYTAAYIKMENNSTLLGYLKNFGSAFVFKNAEQTEFTGNTPYVTEYPEYTNGKMKEELEKTGRYGDGYLETWGWFGDWTNNDASGPFTTRGAGWYDTSVAGVFAFDDVYGVLGHYGPRFPLGVSCAVAL